MSKLHYLRQSHLDRLRAMIFRNIERYKENDPWLDDYFKGDSWALESAIALAEDVALKALDTHGHYDFENTKTLYLALKGLTVSQSTDERLWAFLSHVRFWHYMRSRWPVEDYLDKGNKNVAENLRDRYFFMPNRDRSLVRNGIARLWWYGHVSFDEGRADPFELTRILLSKLDIAQNLLERTFSRNPSICRAVLSVLSDREKAGVTFDDREKFRQLMQHLNRLGGVTVLDALTHTDIEGLVQQKIDQLA